MKLDELKSILLGSASDAVKKEGKELFDKGMVTGLKGKKLNNIYHIYGRVKDIGGPHEFNTHIKIDLGKKSLESKKCSCDEFRQFAAEGYNLMCSHITATAYKFLSLMASDKKESVNPPATATSAAAAAAATARLVRKADKDSVYFKGQKIPGSSWLILKPEELRAFLDSIENRKIRFKYDYIEFTVPILHRDLPVTFNLREDKEHIVITTHKQLPIPLNPQNNVFYFKNEIYLPSENQIRRFAPIYEKLKAHGEIAYKKSMDNYNKLISLLGSITKNINISEPLKNFVSGSSKPEFFLYEEDSGVYCDVFLNCGERRVNILEEKRGTDSLLRDYKKEERLLMEIEKNNFIKVNNRFMFTGEDEELFNILSGKENSIHSLGKVTLGKGLKEKRVYDSASAAADLYEEDGYYDFSFTIGDMSKGELKDAINAYRDKKRFYRTREGDFLDFEDSGIKSFFNIFEVLDIESGEARLEKGKALYLYENIKGRGLGLLKGSEEMEELEDRLNSLNSRDAVIPGNFKGTLREYQLKGFKWLKNLSELSLGGILADEMGLGKTVQTIAFLLSEQTKKSLIVCPTSLIYNWKDEFEKFAPDFRVLIIHGPERPDPSVSIDEYDVLLTTYGTLRIDIQNYSPMVFDLCIIDEGQNIKNAEAQNTRVVKEIKAKTRLALTGTPLENNLTELWSIFDFIMPGYLYTKEKFEEKFILGAQDNLEGLKDLIKPFILRRTKREVIKELPAKIEKKFLVEMTKQQKAVYSAYVNRVKALIKNNKTGKIQIFSYLTRLRQICLDPSLIMEDYHGGSGKLRVAVELIREHIDAGGKVLLFSQFTSALDRIGERLDKEGISFFHLDGKTKPEDRLKRVKEFNSSDSVKVFLISLKAGGTGLNLTSANLVIHFDPWWNPAVEDQASDRAHRIGQKNIVEVIKLVARGTIEEKIILLQEDKKELIKSILTDELQSSDLLGRLSKEDLLKLFDRD